MNAKSFKIIASTLAVILLLFLGIIVSHSPEAVAERARVSKALDQHAMVLEEANKQFLARDRERKAWCIANDAMIKHALSIFVTKIEDGYLGTTATVPYSMWQTLNPNMRIGLHRAIKWCNSKNPDGSLEVVDVNGVVLARM
jgi:hypothetical protein